jgi:hypothetical protein
MAKKSTGLYWLLFFVAVIALISAIVLRFEYLTLIIPFVCIYFVKAMDII